MSLTQTKAGFCQRCGAETTNPVKRDPTDVGWLRECDACEAWDGLALMPPHQDPSVTLVQTAFVQPEPEHHVPLSVVPERGHDPEPPDADTKARSLLRRAKVQERHNPTVATLVVGYLRSVGGVMQEPNGFAAAALREAIGCEHSALRQCLAKMEDLGFISRVIKGRRTYRIELRDKNLGDGMPFPEAFPEGWDVSDECDTDVTDRNLDSRFQKPESDTPPAPVDLSPQRARYADLLINLCARNPIPDLMDRIERTLGVSS